MIRRLFFTLGAVLPLLFACNGTGARIETEPFGVADNGDSVTLYRLINSSGASMEVIDYGCRVVRISVPDRNGVLDDVIVGYGNIDDFEHGRERFFGALLGRYANRIAGACFPLDGDTVRLDCNEMLDGQGGHLHGGTNGFDRQMWHSESFQHGDTLGIRFTRLSLDGEEGYPGNLACDVRYMWCEDNTWRIEYRAVTDMPTIVNMSNHAYFNLKGSVGGTVLDNSLIVDADSTMINNKCYVPCKWAAVEGTPLDFRTEHTFLERIDWPNEQLAVMGGYSADWILNGYDGQMRFAARLSDSQSGRSVEVRTTEPGLLIYTGRGLNDAITSKGRQLAPYEGLILETIHHPDTPNNPSFPQALLRPDESYYSATEYRFSVVQ